MNIRGTLACARVEWKRFFGDRIALFSTVALPVILVLLIGLSFGGGSGRISFGVLEQDPGPLGQQFVTALDQSPALEPVAYEDQKDMFRDIRMGLLGGGVEVTADGQPVTVYLEQTSTDAGAMIAAVNSAAAQVGTQVIAQDVLAEQVPAERARKAVDQAVAEVPPVTVATELVGEQEDQSAFATAVPSQLMLFTFLNGLLGAGALVATRQLGVFGRVLSAPHGLGTFVTGLGLSRLAIALLQAVLLLGLGALWFGLTYGAPAGVTVLVLVYAVVAAAAGMALGALARTPAQATAVAVPLGIVMGMLGGCMWPLSVVPPFMRVIGHLTPQAWAMDAWNLLSDGAGLAGISGQLGVLAGFALALGTIALLGLRRHAVTGR